MTRLALLALMVFLSPFARAQSKPNFLFVYTDDQRWDGMSCVQREEGDNARFPWIQTPNMDRLAAQGIRFRNAFVVNSLCAPSRATFLTGKYSHLNGVANNHTPLPDNTVTHATLLRAAGYTTGYIGKWHMDGQRGQRPGFDYSASFVGQGRYVDCPFEINGEPVATKGWVDDVSANFAIEFLKKNKERPFSLVVGFKSSHGPWEPPERLKDLYAGMEAKPAPNAGATAIYRLPAAKKDGEALPPNPDDAAAGKNKMRANAGRGEMIRNYYRTIKGADENLGRILDALDQLQLADNTIVIFSTDNGYYLGDHGLGDKRSAYEEALRIPLIVRWPRLGNAGKTCDAMVLNLDLAETLCDYAGVPIPAEMQGRSWRPLLESPEHPPKDWRTSFFYEYFYERGFQGTPTVTALRTAGAKLIQYPGHPKWSELFDISADPIETRNLFSDPSYGELRREMERKFKAASEDVKYTVPAWADDPKADTGAKAGAKKAAAGPNLAPKNAWVLDVKFDGPLPGTTKGVLPLVDAGDQKARRFDGSSYIDLGKPANLNPAGSAVTVEVTFKADGPDGMLVARGGKSNGYAVYLVGGKPTFTVNVNNKPTTVTAATAVSGWVTVTAKITADHQASIAVDQGAAVKATLSGFIPADPNDGMQIGADTGSPVTEKAVGNFVGEMRAVRVYSGEAP